MRTQNKALKLSGFTIVELLIVIVVIAILAAISIVAYSGITARANDSQRMSDLAAINKALALYKADHGSYPKTQPNPGDSTWERSTDPGFLSSISDYTEGRVFKAPGGSSYRYHSFNPGLYGCAASYYVLWISGMQAQTGGTKVQTSGCDNQTLFSTATTSGDYQSNATWYVHFGF